MVDVMVCVCVSVSSFNAEILPKKKQERKKKLFELSTHDLAILFCCSRFFGFKTECFRKNWQSTHTYTHDLRCIAKCAETLNSIMSTIQIEFWTKVFRQITTTNTNKPQNECDCVLLHTTYVFSQHRYLIYCIYVLT